METIRHFAIVVSSWHRVQLRDAHHKAITLFSKAFGDEDGGALVSNIIQGVVYPQSSFFIAPDGLEKHARLYQKGRDARRHFLQWLREYKNYCSYVEIAFGNGETPEQIVRCNSWDAIMSK